ncbi:UDP-N-acetylglucosamine--N-acetylmuramyl-(pentapeptide) pyrophosphoryl-undecaprenol N-acetylglucosamine transferase [Tetragenococcus halophilus subsp. halophilus]|uniref:undecaprenyldiphospho-muramoylpentapeptide beta-N-acetylglucosaminyltransferase n=1 Tax=Tetragenococcus halophilus TaxID=51669 RepID=UPI00083D3694|nr:undecaprenyldiphospho-muramoylpentapeptide beta-N-acetylglucosaminyltransferase [Tetragenococcus halophilus]AOF49399.1 UDP-diphospho-muramoylpentapeptide beta-N-acetylglucosaminyltransferase [Tetragenococcus halophilus]MCO7025985.1 undecaprenyldiphospho-muramoylpentapeptide beta-N-acetylglucosaminyltransferase [Tetragenococcus halophilus]GBD60724.1 UDP-N-acetylglucosamine--N-acetylmuramyl-(pentapeptide) pyrophosphoryl-undecaprenol N-acetylglucosamine transferase [Tetragenococcus halophilus su
MKILVTGGGTGGHIYPGLAFINYVKKISSDSSFLYVGAKRGMENKILPQTDIPFLTLEIQGFKRKLTFENFKTIQLFLKSIRQAKKIIKDFQPDVVIGTGGYVSGAVVYAASKLNVPTVVHEQNSVPGITNKFLARYVDKVGIAFKDAAQYFPKDKTVLVGNPRAQEIVGIQRSDLLRDFDLDPEKKTLLVFGGSQGALKINQAVVAAIPEFAKKDYQILYASGERYYEEINETIGMTKDAFTNISIKPYIKNMTEVMANCELLVGRAGATSIAEFTGLGLPAVLIPSPYVTNDHQAKNAMSLVNNGAAKMIKDDQLTAENLVATVDEIMEDDTLLQQMAAESKKQGIPDAAQRLYQLVQSII